MNSELLRANWDRLDGFESDQRKGIGHPPLQRTLPEGTGVMPLPEADPEAHGEIPLGRVIESRRSRRSFTDQSITMEEFSWLLWSTQGIQKVLKEGVASLRTVPSGGARHPFDTWLFVNRVEGLEPGLYLYRPVDHAVARMQGHIPPEAVSEACLGQQFAGNCAVCFAWTAIPYRTAWRYGPVSEKVILLDAGHVCQNLYLACTAMGLGTCAIGAYDQERIDALLGIDGQEELVVYVAPVGRMG